MGHCKKGKSSSSVSTQRGLRHAAYDRLSGMKSFGDSRHADKAYDRDHDTNITFGKIYSQSSFDAYWKHTKYFLRYVGEQHPECRTLKEAREYIPEWIQGRIDEGLAAHTIHLEAASVYKLYGIQKDDPIRLELPRRLKEDITRSRGPKPSDRHFSEKNNAELVAFARGVGARRGVLERLTGDALYTRDRAEAAMRKAQDTGNAPLTRAFRDALRLFPGQEYFVLHERDKGGKTRLSPIVGPNTEKIVERFRATGPDEKVWLHVSKNADIHGYRSDYASAIYKQYARPVEQLDFGRKIRCADGKYRSEIYSCRGADAGKRLDREAVHAVSVALGHNREDTAIVNYLRGL